MKGLEPPRLALAELESILFDVSDLLGRIPNAPGALALDGRVVQCHVAIAACRRHQFSPPLLRALSAKVLEVETDALVLRRTVRVPERLRAEGNDGGRVKRSRWRQR